MDKPKVINMDEVWHSKRINKHEFGSWTSFDYIEIYGRRTKMSEKKIVFRMKVKDFLYVIKSFKRDVQQAKLKADKDISEYNEIR